MNYKTLLLPNGTEISEIKKIAKKDKNIFGSYSKALNYYSKKHTSLSFNKAIKLSKKYNLTYYHYSKTFNRCRFETDFYYKNVKKTIIIDAFGVETKCGRYLFKNKETIPFDSFKNLDNKKIKRDGTSLMFEFLDSKKNAIRIEINQKKGTLYFKHFKNDILINEKYDKFFYNKIKSNISKIFLDNLEDNLRNTNHSTVHRRKDYVEYISLHHRPYTIKYSIVNEREILVSFTSKERQFEFLADIYDYEKYVDCEDIKSDFSRTIMNEIR